HEDGSGGARHRSAGHRRADLPAPDHRRPYRGRSQVVKHRSTRILLTTAALTFSVCTIPAAAVESTSDELLSDAGLVELSETARLADRRSLVTGDRFIALGDESGLYPASGWHIRGEMGGFWTPPVKLLDGMWFAVDNSWLGTDIGTARYTSGWGY